MTVLALSGGMSIEQAVEALRDIGADPVMRHNRDGSEYWLHRCAHPEHHDNWPSATLTTAPDGTLLLNCFACAPQKGDPARRRWVAQVLGRLTQGTPKDPPTGAARSSTGSTGSGVAGTKTAHYDYVSEAGEIVARKVRFQQGTRKTFLWQRPHGEHWADGLRGKPLRELPLYGLHSVGDAPQVYIVEGEKDVDRLHTLGVAAVCPAGSQPGDIPTDLSMLTGRLCIVVADRDPHGATLARAWHARLPDSILAQSRTTAPKSDVSDHLDAGYTLDQLDFGTVPPAQEPTPGSETPDADGTPPVPPETEDALFGATSALQHIRQAARARLISPIALLGAVLARVVAELHPCVVLPPIIGTRASLNLYVGIVGPSGAAKTAAAGVADDLLFILFGKARVQGTGSGEGLIASFLKKDPDAAETHGDPFIVRDDPNVCVLIDEIGMLGSVQNRTGSTMAPVLRSGWSGAALETINADPSRKRVVPKMQYRLTVIAGIQPLAADVLFNDADTGTPQRWVWLPALDRRMPDMEPEWPGPLKWQAPSLVDSIAGFVTVTVPDHIRDTLRTAHRARHRGTDRNHLDGHLALTRLKVAAALAALHGAYPITDQWWILAGLIMDISMGQRTACQQALAAEASARAESRGRTDHARDIGKAQAVAATTDKDARLVARQVKRHFGDDFGAGRSHPVGHGCSGRCITLALTRRDSAQKSAAVDHAEAMAWIVKNPAGRHLPGPSQPSEGGL